MVLLALLLLDWTVPARELARKIFPAAGAADLSLSMRNLSSLSAAEAAAARRALESELRERGARIQASGANVRVTLAESVREYVWTAEFRRGEGREVAIVPVRRPEQVATSAVAVTIDKSLLWQQDLPLLDVARVDEYLVVLEPSRLVFYQGQEMRHSAPMVPSPSPSRDPRGRLRVDDGSIGAFLFGWVCRAPRLLSPDAVCAASAEPTLLEQGSTVRGRNYFSVIGGVPYYSSATAEDGGKPVRLYSGVDGATRLESGEIVGHWGSDIAGIESKCGRMVLATRASEPDATDAIQAYQIVDGRAVAAGDPVEFAGPVTALWSAGDTATVVARNAQTGRYAAYSLAVGCGR